MAGRIGRHAAAAVKIRIRAGGGEALIGTGHLLAPGLVLTARHVLRHLGNSSDASRLRVRGGDQSVKVAAMVALGELDAVGLLVPGLNGPPGRIVGSAFRGDRPLESCSVIGFPEVGSDSDQVLAEYLEVSVLPTVDDRIPRLALAVHTPLPVDPRSWEGLSGAGVLDPDGHLLGIVTHVPLQWTGRLHAVPIEPIMRAAESASPKSAPVRAFIDLPLVEITGEDPLVEPVARPQAVIGDDQSLFELLHYRNRAVPFVTEGEAARIITDSIEWVRARPEEPDVSVMVLTGPAGTGKSRLAAEICDRLARTDRWWRTGFADYAELSTARPPSTPLLAVCDYPERQPEAVGAFISRAIKLRREGTLQAPVRVLLVSRTQGEWFDRIRDHAPGLDALVGLRAELPLSGFSEETQAAHAQQAYASFALRFGRDAMAPPGLERYDRPLTIHIAALMAASGEPLPDPSEDDPARALLDQLIRRESRRWLAFRDDGGGQVFTDLDRGMEALCVSTLTAPFKAHLPELLKAVPTLADAHTERRSTIADALHELYPDGKRRDDRADPRVAPVEPDLVAAHLLAGTASRSQIVRNLVDSNVLQRYPAYHARLMHALLLAADEYPQVESDLKDHLATSLSALTGAAAHTELAELLESSLLQLVAIAVRNAANDRDLTAARHLALALDLPHNLIESTVAENAIALLAASVVPTTNAALAGLGSALAGTAVRYWRSADTESPDNETTAKLADASAELGIWQELDDRHQAAYISKQRAVDLYEQLAGDDDRFIPDLARATNNFSIATAIAGEWPTALRLAQRAVELWRYSDEHLSGDYRASLALGRSNLSLSLLDAYRPEEALGMAGRAVRAFEQLCGDDPDQHLPNLRRALNAHADSLAEVGRPADAVTVDERAIELAEELARGNRSAHLPDLARAVTSLAIHLESAGRPREALAPRRRAVHLWKESTERMPGAYGPEYAGAVGDLALYLSREGQKTQSLTASNQAVDIADRYARADRHRYQPILAAALDTAVTVRLNLNAELTNALYLADRAVSILTELAAADPRAFAERLAIMRDAQRQIHRRLTRAGDKWTQDGRTPLAPNG
ncbi:trypsin-like peptidase domain-containing protein [Glycomyces buryatensis]|uniref:Tetratricopeptide repeat protein n=1 Tax=Glycomyces buryatensis TaxID=2570927 RepID=A0A4V4HSP2_9ACTN|nr:trypsin-like peptidase domain-containing protein [Glycomyces buryatensis]THV42456.1 hypothetical protein FAB82_06165 [Glycomyces buryatensis]